MSQRKHAYVCVKVRGERPAPRVIAVSWTSKTERNRVVKASVTAWAKTIWKRQSVEVDVTTLDLDRGGVITINGETEAVCKFWLEAFIPKPTPISALFAAGGAS